MGLALWRCALVWYFIHCVRSQGVALITFNSSAVYSREPVKLTFIYGSGHQLTELTVDAFNGTLKKGSLFYQVAPNNWTAVGVFAGIRTDVWPYIPWDATNISVTLTATPSLELEYNFTARIFDSEKILVYTLSSLPVSLRLFVLPLPPSFTQNPISFNESDSAIVVCESRYGKPAANITLTVVSAAGRKEITASTESASLMLPKPVADWHGATATCVVTNHNFSNSIVSSNVTVNHINNNRMPTVLYTSTNNVTLDCAAYISSYPDARYSWFTQFDTNVTDNSVATGSSIVTLMQPVSGLCICIATNRITMKAVAVAFTAQIKLPACTSTSGCEHCWVIGPTVGAVVAIIVVVLGVLYKRGQCSERLSSKRTHKNKQSDTFCTEQNVIASTSLQSGGRQYEHLNAQQKIVLTYDEFPKDENGTSNAAYENLQRYKQSS